MEKKALCDTFSHEFGFAQSLTCFIHVRSNIKAKLLSATSLSVKILDDIFGRVDGTFVEGLVDVTDDEDFQEKQMFRSLGGPLEKQAAATRRFSL